MSGTRLTLASIAALAAVGLVRRRGSGARRPSISGVELRRRQGGMHAPVLELVHDGKVVGHLQADDRSHSEWGYEGCEDEAADLAERLGLGADPVIYAVWRTGIDKGYRRRGYGVMLYEGMLDWLSEHFGKPVILVPELCLMGEDDSAPGDTSESALRVWSSIQRRYESEGWVTSSVRKQGSQNRQTRTFYHGTADPQHLVRQGVRLDVDRRRDPGDMGWGFYLTRRIERAGDHGTGVVAVDVDMSRMAKIRTPYSTHKGRRVRGPWSPAEQLYRSVVVRPDGSVRTIQGRWPERIAAARQLRDAFLAAGYAGITTTWLYDEETVIFDPTAVVGLRQLQGSRSTGGYMPPFAGLVQRQAFDRAHDGTDQNPMRDLDDAVARGQAPDGFELGSVLDWLEDQRQAGRWGRNTYWYYRHPELSVAKLLRLPGQKGEHRHMGTTSQGRFSDAYIGKLSVSMRQKGFEPKRAIQVFTWGDGTATIWEGNHRLRAAQRVGLETIPVDWRYVAGAERDPGALHASDFAVDR